MTQDTARLGRVSRGEVVSGQYELERILGQGGMGTVWRARDLRLGRPVAIKFLGETAAVNPVQRERFAREARLAGRVRSPHVAQIFADGITSSGVPYVVMELLDGENLATYIARVGRCTLQETDSILEQVCRGLSAAHAAGLVHRDIKPANIFLTPQPHSGTFVRLLDFGIAKDMSWSPRTLTRSGEVLGTGYYMSPEQLRSPQIVGAATDIWSLGVVLYEMLTGHVPFDAETFPELVVRVVTGELPPPSELCPDLPGALDAVAARALQVDPSQRYANVHELYSAFARVVRAHTSEAVIKPEVMRALRRSGDTTERLIGIKRIQQLTTQLFRRDAPRWARVGLGVLLVCAGSALALALLRWADPEIYETAIQPLRAAPAPAADDLPPLPAPPVPAAVSGEPARELAVPSGVVPPTAAPEIAPPSRLSLEPGGMPEPPRARSRRKRPHAPVEPAVQAPTPAQAPSPSDESKYGF